MYNCRYFIRMVTPRMHSTKLMRVPILLNERGNVTLWKLDNSVYCDRLLLSPQYSNLCEQARRLVWKWGGGGGGLLFGQVEKKTKYCLRIDACWTSSLWILVLPNTPVPLPRVSWLMSIILSWLKPCSPNEDTNMLQSGNSLGLVLEESLQAYYPDWETFILIETLFSHEDTNSPQSGNPWLTTTPFVCQLYYPDWEILLSWLKPYSPNGDTNSPQSGNPWLTTTPFVCQLYYPDWEILLSWLKPYSPNGDTNSPQSRNPWVDSDTFCLNTTVTNIPSAKKCTHCPLWSCSMHTSMPGWYTPSPSVHTPKRYKKDTSQIS